MSLVKLEYIIDRVFSPEYAPNIRTLQLWAKKGIIPARKIQGLWYIEKRVADNLGNTEQTKLNEGNLWRSISEASITGLDSSSKAEQSASQLRQLLRL